MEGPGFEFRYGQQIFIFFKSVKTDSGESPHPASYLVDTGVHFQGIKPLVKEIDHHLHIAPNLRSGGAWKKLTTHLHIAPSLRSGGAWKYIFRLLHTFMTIDVLAAVILAVLLTSFREVP